MIMKNETFTGIVGNSIAAIFTAVQQNQILQTISFILTSVSVIITIAFTIYNWYRKAKADGKITPDEIKDLHDDLKDVLKDKEEEKKDE